METTPGTMKAARHEITSVSVPATTAAMATPRLPNTPLMPSSLPRALAFSATMAMPTGW